MQPSEEDIAWFKSTFHPIPKATLPEDCIEYRIHLISEESDVDNDSESRLQLREVQKYANELQRQWLKGYIWQRQGFSLELTKEDGEVGVSPRAQRKSSNLHAGSSHLHGRTEYGDSIEDEWVVVWLLRELSRKFKNIWVKLTDSDGEFLLIEASGTIPAWLEPEVAEHRVWINDGQLKILKPAGNKRSSKQTSEKLSLQDARRIILKEPKRILHSESVEEEAFYRLRNYPAQINDNMHYALATIPRKVAFLLTQRPAYIAPAIEAFYLRDPIALKPLQKSSSGDELRFPLQDLVTVSLKFPRVGYAQIRSQDFPAPNYWKKQVSIRVDPKERARIDTGMKITCGFEMLLSDSQHQDKQPVREMKMVLEDLETGDETLPSDGDIAKLGDREDDENWLDISFDDLERELGGKSKDGSTGKKPEFGDKATQENLQRIVKQFESFLNEDKDDSDDGNMAGESSDLGEDDDDSDESDDGEDKDASFDEDEFTRMMQEMMGLPPDVMKEMMSGDIDALNQTKVGNVPPEVAARAKAKVEELDTSDEDIEDERQMERELRESGALNLDSMSTAKTTKRSIVDEEGDVPEDDEPVSDGDFDAEFARNILRSFKSSAGTGGPAATLMSMMNGSSVGEGSRSQRKG